MACLPDEVWIEALRSGVHRGVLDHRDLCSLSISSHALNKLCVLPSLWKPLFQRDFPQEYSSASSSDFKSRYRSSFEKIKASKVAAHRRHVLRIQSERDAHENECKELEREIQGEKLKLSNILQDLKNIEQARMSSVALRMWQPQMVCTMQQQLVEQHPIDSEFRKNSLEMEAKICKEEIRRCCRRIDRKKQIIEKIEKDLEYLTYNPLQDSHESLPRNRLKKSKAHNTKC